MKSFQQFTEGKDSKLEAKYQDKPKGNQKCSECTMWRPPNRSGKAINVRTK